MEWLWQEVNGRKEVEFYLRPSLVGFYVMVQLRWMVCIYSYMPTSVYILYLYFYF